MTAACFSPISPGWTGWWSKTRPPRRTPNDSTISSPSSWARNSRPTLPTRAAYRSDARSRWRWPRTKQERPSSTSFGPTTGARSARSTPRRSWNNASSPRRPRNGPASARSSAQRPRQTGYSMSGARPRRPPWTPRSNPPPKQLQTGTSGRSRKFLPGPCQRRQHPHRQAPPPSPRSSARTLRARRFSPKGGDDTGPAYPDEVELDPLRFRHRVARAQRAEDAGQVREVVDLELDFVGVERPVELRLLELDDAGMALGEDVGHLRERAEPVIEHHAEPADRALRAFAPRQVDPVGIDAARQLEAVDRMDHHALTLDPQPDDAVARHGMAAFGEREAHSRRQPLDRDREIGRGMFGQVGGAAGYERLHHLAI